MKAISKKNEEKALILLLKMCKENLGKFPDSWESDIQLLKKDNLTYNERNCIMFRAGEKRIYNFFIKFATHAIEVLKGKAKPPEDMPKMKAYYASIQHLLTN